MLAGAQDVVGVFATSGRVAGDGRRSSCEKPITVQRRAHLVAHAREELALGAAGEFGGLLVEQRLLGLPRSA